MIFSFLKEIDTQTFIIFIMANIMVTIGAYINNSQNSAKIIKDTFTT